MHVGGLRFGLIDFGWDILRNTQTQLRIGAVWQKERKQFGALHLGVSWARRVCGRGKAVPARGGIYHRSMTSLMENEAEEKEESHQIANPTCAQHQLIMSHSHDALKTVRHRGFRGISFSLF